jgi:hypothetical protein
VTLIVLLGLGTLLYSHSSSLLPYSDKLSNLIDYSNLYINLDVELILLGGLYLFRVCSHPLLLYDLPSLLDRLVDTTGKVCMNLAHLTFETTSNSIPECLCRDAPPYRSVLVTEMDDRLKVIRRQDRSKVSCRLAGCSPRSTRTTAPTYRSCRSCRGVQKGVLEGYRERGVLGGVLGLHYSANYSSINQKLKLFTILYLLLFVLAVKRPFCTNYIRYVIPM